MKITDLKCAVIGKNPIARIVTDEGISGYGEAESFKPYLKPSVLQFREALLGEDPTDVERVMLKIRQRGAFKPYGAAVSIIEHALWDIAGKAAGMPIHRLLGTTRHSIPAYASSAILPSMEEYAEEAVRFREANWAAYKIHPPQRPREDITVCQAVRRAVGDEYTLMLDSTWAYDFPAAMRVGRAIEELGFLWYEDPLHDQDITSYVKLRQKLDIPIMATEYPATGLESYAPWIMMQATDYLRGDVAVKGGITTLMKTAHLAEAFRMNYEVHHGGNSLNNVANLHVCCAIRNTSFFEVLLPDGAHKYGLAEDIAVGPDGMVQAPQGPGLGAAIDFDLIDRKRIAVLE